MLKVLHITNEITKKNFSISSLINFISLNGLKKNLFKSEVLCSNKDHGFNEENLNIIEIKWKNFYKLRTLFLNKIINYDIIQIHGVWAPIQLYSIILCLIYNKKTIIHPHGMLLPAAVNYNGLIKRINKKIFLFFLKFLFLGKKNIIFVAITKQEFTEIERLFSGLKVELIQNNIPFENIDINLAKNLEKVFVFFGRIHPHKNVLEMIKIFIKSDLIKHGWKFEIYGIRDDINYLKKIEKFILKFPEIKICNPVFGSEKSEIISRSWANVLISKSEVLSFSIMESGIYGLPSIITTNIETLEKDAYSEKVENKQNKIIKKFQEIAEWSISKRKLIGDKTKLFFNNYKNESDILILEKLNNSYYDLVNKKFYNEGNSSENFYIASAVQSLNVFMPNIILLLCFFFFSNELTAEIGLTNIIFITATQMLSGNIRLIAIKKRNIDFLQENLVFRLYIGIIFFVIYQIIQFNLNFIEYNYINLIISFYIILLWCSELVLSVYEIKRMIGKLINIFLIYILIFTLLLITFVFGEIEHLTLILSSICVILVLFYFGEIKFTKFTRLNYSILNIFFKDILKYFSSLSLTISSLCWRLYLFFTYPKEISGIIFIAFAICSFPGTFFNNVLGPNFFYNKININSKIKYFFILIFLTLLFYNIFYFEIIKFSEISNHDLFIHILKISGLGSFLMFYGMYIRQELVFKKKINLNNLFYKDIFYGFILILILPTLDTLGGLNLLSYSYLLGSVLAIIIFKIRLNKQKIKIFKA